MARAELRRFLATSRTWRGIAVMRSWPTFTANPNLLDGLRRIGMPKE